MLLAAAAAIPFLMKGMQDLGGNAPFHEGVQALQKYRDCLCMEKFQGVEDYFRNMGMDVTVTEVDEGTDRRLDLSLKYKLTRGDENYQMVLLSHDKENINYILITAETLVPGPSWDVFCREGQERCTIGYCPVTLELFKLGFSGGVSPLTIS